METRAGMLLEETSSTVISEEVSELVVPTLAVLPFVVEEEATVLLVATELSAFAAVCTVCAVLEVDEDASLVVPTATPPATSPKTAAKEAHRANFLARLMPLPFFFFFGSFPEPLRLEESPTMSESI